MFVSLIVVMCVVGLKWEFMLSCYVCIFDTFLMFFMVCFVYISIYRICSASFLYSLFFSCKFFSIKFLLMWSKNTISNVLFCLVCCCCCCHKKYRETIFISEYSRSIIVSLHTIETTIRHDFLTDFFFFDSCPVHSFVRRSVWFWFFPT